MSNVRVCAKIRPQNEREDKEGSHICVSNTTTDVILDASKKEKFNFDHVFGPETNQEDVFERVGLPLVDTVLSGINCTLFAYGQSGSGKTFTMEGAAHTGNLAGVIPRITHRLFADIAKQPAGIEFAVRASYVEIYNDRVRDLLDSSGTKENLAVRQDKIKGVYIENVTEEYITSGEDGMRVFDHGSSIRKVAATGLNAGSSRSHAIFQLQVIQTNHTNGSETSSRIVLCDLAGSETAKKTGAKGQQMKEAQAINQSLSALGNVIKAMTSSKIKHVPFRDSKLTRMLQDAIGGNSRTTLMICLSPSKFNVEESVSTCRFGARAKLIKNKEKKNVVRSVAELEGLVAKEEAKRAVLKRQLQALLQLLEKHNLDPKDAGVDPMSVKLLEQALAQDAPPGLGGGGRGGGGVGGPGAGAASHAGGYSAAAAVAPKTAEELEEEREEAARVSAEIKQLTGMIGSKTERLTQVRALLSEVSAAVDGLEATHSAIRGLQDEMEARHFREQEDLFAAGDLKLELETLQQENDTIKAEGTAGDFEAERHHLRSEVKNLQSSLVLIGKLHQSMTVEQAKAAGAPSSKKALDDKMAQLGKRLEQMVKVHKKVLRKHAEAESSHRDVAKCVANRDKKIGQLEAAVASLKESLRVQAEEQAEEMAKVRDHVTKLTELGGGWFSKKRTLRGGGTLPMPGRVGMP